MKARSFVALALFAACCKGPAPSAPTAALAGRVPGEASQRVQLRTLDERPPLALVARLGDPYAAVSFAAAHDAGSEASVALAALVEARLVAQGFPAPRARAHALGFELASFVETPERAARFVSAVSNALRTPVSAGDAALGTVAQRLATLRGRSVTGAGQAAVAACTGELGLRAPLAAWDPTTPAGAARVESWRRQVDSARASAFAALGPAEVLEAAEQALRTTSAWPASPEPVDAWPERDVVGVDAVANGRRQLSVALRVGSAPAAFDAAHALGQPESTLALRVRAQPPAWTLERVMYTARPRGACLRVDVTAPPGEPAPAADEVARIALVAFEEAELALRSSSGASLDEAVLRPTDPRDAASVAAWRALCARHEPGPTRRLVSYETHGNELGASGSAALERALQREASAWKQRSIEQRARIEPGQGELWALLASPCGTLGETRHDAGLGALVVRALAAKRSRIGEVTLEPWVHPDGLGLLAHAPRRSPSESATLQAERVGAALGRAMASTRLSGTDIAAARAHLLEEIGPSPLPGWWLALDTTAAGHPSWLEARGTWNAVSEATLHAAEARRMTFVREPLRLAVLASSDQSQVDAVMRSVERWLRPLRTGAERCPAPKVPAPQPGELKVETQGERSPTGYVAVALPPAAAPAAEWTLFLLNRPGGWLDQALRLPGIAAARAHLIGGSRARALVVEVTALDAEPRAAVQQVRALFDRLAAGGASQRDVEVAKKTFEKLDVARALEPRRRVVELWRATPRAPRPNLADLRALHQALRADRHVVVLVESR